MAGRRPALALLSSGDDPWAMPQSNPAAEAAASTIERLRREVAAARDETAAVRAALTRESEIRGRLAEQVAALAAHAGFTLPDLPLYLSPPRPPASALPDDVPPF